MKKSTMISGLLASSFLLAASTFAGNSNKGSLKVPESVTVGGKQIPAGEYKVEWTGSGSNVEVSILNGKETVAKVPAQVVPLNKPSLGDGYSTSARQDGSKALTDIYLRDKKYELVLGEASAATPASSAKAQGSN
jgi:hypothetical protein